VPRRSQPCSHTESSRALAVLALALLAAAARRGTRLTRRMSFNRDAISETHDVPALLVPAKRTSAYVKALRRHLVDVPRYRTVASVDDSSKKKILLSRQLPRDDPASALPEEAAAFLRKALDDGEAQPTTHQITLAYDHFTAEEVLRKLLPSSVSTPSAFEHVGHVAHLNLRPEHDPYKTLIGEVLLDKVANVRTVVNKVGEISTEYRTYELEVLGGDPSTQVELREQDCVFRFDVRDVYWNSRLQSEHARLSATIPRDARVADCTCGVGPFSIPLSKRGVACYANDLNPKAVEFLRENALLNKCSQLQISEPSCARSFLRQITEWEPTHCIYNLPATGIDLLDVFRDFEGAAPIVHCYCFGKSRNDADAMSDVHARCVKAVGASLPIPDKLLPSPAARDAATIAENGFAVRWVRNVSPNKDMYCASFRAPSSRKRARTE
jgi:tRNA (guanine37-N1)-methyltransferase